MKTTENTRIKEWYMNTYPTDDLGADINPNITFYDMFVVLDTYKDVYEALNVGDSLIRERVFSELAKIMDVDYDYIYQQWLRGI